MTPTPQQPILPFYYGVKCVQAEPENRGGKWGYRVIYEHGGESWSPKDVFEKFYLRGQFLPASLSLEAIERLIEHAPGLIPPEIIGTSQSRKSKKLRRAAMCMQFVLNWARMGLPPQLNAEESPS